MRIMILGMVLASVSVPAMATSNSEEEEKCELSNVWEDGTTLIVRQDQEMFDRDRISIFFHNLNWSIAEGDDIEQVRIETNEEAWLQGKPRAGKNAFLLFTKYEHAQKVLDDFPVIWEVTKSGKLITRVNMTEVSLDWTSFQRCRDKRVAVVQERERRERLKREIPVDPFAND